MLGQEIRHTLRGDVRLVLFAPGEEQEERTDGGKKQPLGGADEWSDVTTAPASEQGKFRIVRIVPHRRPSPGTVQLVGLGVLQKSGAHGAGCPVRE